MALKLIAEINESHLSTTVILPFIRSKLSQQTGFSEESIEQNNFMKWRDNKEKE